MRKNGGMANLIVEKEIEIDFELVCDVCGDELDSTQKDLNGRVILRVKLCKKCFDAYSVFYVQRQSWGKE